MMTLELRGEERADRLRGLLDLTHSVASARQPDEIYEAALTCLRDTLRVDRSSILLFDASGHMRFKASRGLSAEYRAAVDGHSPWTPETRDAAPVLVPDVRTDESLAALREVIEGEGIRALAFVPLAIGERLLGKFMLYYAKPHVFDGEEILIARTIAAHVAFAIDQQEHRETEGRYRRLIDALGVAMYMTDPEGHIRMFNEAAARLWGRRPTIGEDMWCGSWRLRGADGKPIRHDECPMAVALKERRSVRGEAAADRQDGTTVPFLAFSTPLFDEDGEMVGGVNVLIDITERKLAERRLTEALAVKDEFLGLVSHELKTPLTAIRGNADVLQRSIDSLDRRDRDEALRDIVQESERLQRIIENLLFLAMAEHGRLAEREPVLVVHIVEEVIARHLRRSPGREILVAQDAAPRPVSFPPGYLELVIDNLLTNAGKYSPPDAPITIRLDRTEHEVSVRVLDEGPGIDQDQADKLFEPFFRGDKAAQRASGIGIGLAVCRRLVESQGGRMWARRREPIGSEFGFALPITPEDHE
jgi:PAS domain S-box-containing protein